jgi:dipeptidyl aminopeptidase/acylaminoacyl peptidase
MLASCQPNTELPLPTAIESLPTKALLLTSTQAATPSSPATIIPTSTPWPFKSMISPNGEFVANAYFENQLPSGMQTIEIRNKENKLLWQIPYQGELPTGDPRPLLNIFQWSNDSSQLYFYYVWSPDGGDRAFWWTGYDLQKFDIKTGEIQQILPGKGFMSFSISPDGKQIAYTRRMDQPSVIYVRDLSTGVEKTAYVIFRSKNYVRVGDIRWSPTNKELAFQTETDELIVQTIYLNLLTMKQRVIREYFFDKADFHGWTSDGKLEFKQYNKGLGNYEIVHIDVDNGELMVIGTPTPKP